MQRIAVLIGNGRFPLEPELTALQGPANDVQRLEEVLRSPEVGAFDQVLRLVDEEHYRITPVIDEVLSNAGPDTFVLLYYSGHGKLSVRGQLCLATHDTRVSQLQSTSLLLPVLKGFIDESRCRQVLIVLDCCFSGAAGKAFLRGSIDDQLVLSTADASGLHILSSSTALEVSHEREVAEGDTVMGAFTRCVVDGLRTGDADINGDGKITVTDLREYVERSLRGQRPRYWGIDAGGEPVIGWSQARREQQRHESERRRLGAAQQRVTDWYLAGKLRTPIYLRVLACLAPDEPGTARPVERSRIIELLEDDRTTPHLLVTAWHLMDPSVSTAAPPGVDEERALPDRNDFIQEQPPGTPDEPGTAGPIERSRVIELLEEDRTMPHLLVTAGHLVDPSISMAAPSSVDEEQALPDGNDLVQEQSQGTSNRLSSPTQRARTPSEWRAEGLRELGWIFLIFIIGFLILFALAQP